MEEWAAVCRHVKAVEEEYMSREHKMDSVMERITINADDDEDDMSESTVSCEDDDIQEVGPIVSDSEWSEVSYGEVLLDKVKWTVLQWSSCG